MRKLRFVSALTACALMLGTAVMPELVMKPLLTVSAEDTEEVTEYTYGALTYTTDGTSVTITRCAMGTTSVDIPIEIDGLPVTALDPQSFNVDSLKEITVEEGHPYFTAIDGALYNKDVTVFLCWPRGKDADVVIAEGVHTIGEWAFHYGFINSVTLPSTLTTISEHAFMICEIDEKVIIPDSVTTIGDYAFCNAGYSFGLDVSLPSTLTSIGKGVFSGSGLGKIVIPEGVTSIGDYAFSDCEYLNYVTLPEGLEVIGNSAFSNSYYLFSINFPESLTTIGDHAFGSTDFSSAYFTENLTYIGEYAFEWSALSHIYYSGTRDEWDAVSIHENNPRLLNTAVYCNFIPSVMTLGELNDDQVIDALDASMLLQASAAAGTDGGSILTEEQMIEADVNADGTFDANDAACILQYSAYRGTGGYRSLADYLN